MDLQQSNSLPFDTPIALKVKDFIAIIVTKYAKTTIEFFKKPVDESTNRMSLQSKITKLTCIRHSHLTRSSKSLMFTVPFIKSTKLPQSLYQGVKTWNSIPHINLLLCLQN